MHKAWLDAMFYFGIPMDEAQPFYDWYCQKYPSGDWPVSAAYEEWKAHDISQANAHLQGTAG